MCVSCAFQQQFTARVSKAVIPCVCEQMESERVSEQKDAFLKRLADTEAHSAVSVGHAQWIYSLTELALH